MNILDKNKLITKFQFTDFYYFNNKNINDIVKFSISDDDIDYSLQKDEIKNLQVFDLNYKETINNSLLTDLKSNNSISYKSSSDGQISNFLDDIKLHNASYLDLEFTDEGYFISFENCKFVNKVLVDLDGNSKFLDKDYIYIKSKIRIFFNKLVSNGIITVYSVKNNLLRQLKVLYN